MPPKKDKAGVEKTLKKMGAGVAKKKARRKMRVRPNTTGS
jgi:hypothetical protein